LAALDWDGTALHLVALDRLAEPKDIVRWVQAQAGENAGIGIDAPIVIPNAAGMRVADRLAHSFYGKYHAGAYPASRARSFWKRTTGLSSRLVRLGFRHGDELSARIPGRFQIEVHPHAAAVQLFALDRIVKYKKGALSARSAELARLRQLMLDRLPALVPSLALDTLPEIPARAADLKDIEDRLDAVISAYVAAHWWYWGRERNEVHGDCKQGYIIVPHRQTATSAIADRPAGHIASALEESQLDPDPIAQFHKWFAEAKAAGIAEPHAMTLATTGPDGQPSARMVLLKDCTGDGFVFYTNYNSRKAREMAACPKAALVFYWHEMHRQVRITGSVTKATRPEAEAYFATRPRGSQLAAWASWQSSVIPDRPMLEDRMTKLQAKYDGRDVPAPPNWGGYRVKPDTIEFWQGRLNRLHDRLRYERTASGWKIERLAP
jgi:pyridoxamine 5'-phosphate oxidase